MPLGDEFKGLPMENLIGAPLSAACSANLQLAQATADFISAVGFEVAPDGSQGALRTAEFQYQALNDADPAVPETYKITTPLLAIVPIPSLKVDKVDITFDMEVKTSESSSESTNKEGSFEGSGSVGWGPFKLKVKVAGSVSTHSEHTRSTDKSAKYHVQVSAVDNGMSEGLARVLDIMNKSVAPLPA